MQPFPPVERLQVRAVSSLVVSLVFLPCVGHQTRSLLSRDSGSFPHATLGQGYRYSSPSNKACLNYAIDRASPLTS